MATRRSSSATTGRRRGWPVGRVDAGKGAQSWIVQFARSSLTSARWPAAGRTSTARSGAPSPLKSPTSPSSRTGSTARPKACTTAARTSRERAGVKSAPTTAGRRCSTAAGDGGSARSTCAGWTPARESTNPAPRATTARARVATRAVLAYAMGIEEGREPAGGWPAPFTASEGVEERDQLALLVRAEELVVDDHVVRFARVAQDGLVAGERLAVVHQPIAAAHAPQRRRAHPVARGLPAVLDDPVPRAHVVEEEVAERVNRLVAQGGRHRERALVDDRAHRRGGDVADVADVAADGVEELAPRLGVGSGGEGRVARRHAGGTHELGELVDIALHVLGVLHAVAHHPAVGRVVRRQESIRDALLVEVSVGGEGQQAGLLVLPPESAATDAISSLEHRHLDELPLHAEGLGVGDGDEGVAVDGVHEAIAQDVEGRAEGTDFIAPQHAFLEPRVDGAIVDERPAGVFDEVETVEMAGAQLGDLADAAGDGVRVTIPAGRRVVDGAKALGQGLLFLEGAPVRVEHRLVDEAIGEEVHPSVEGRRRLGRGRGGL